MENSLSDLLNKTLIYLPWLVAGISLAVGIIALINAILINRNEYKGMEKKFDEMEKRVEKKLDS